MLTFALIQIPLNINVWNLPNADAGTDLWICPGGSVNLSANGGVSIFLVT